MKTSALILGRVSVVLSLAIWNVGSSSGSASDTWKWEAVGRSSPPDGRIDLSTVWTGHELLLWGGRVLGGRDEWKNDGFRYDPSTDRWKPISTLGAPEPRCYHTAIWTGRELIIWGGRRPDGAKGESYNTGARYNPVSDQWTPVTMRGVPTRRDSHTAIWTGTEMIVWGGYSAGYPDTWNDGGRYDPATDSWKPLSTANTPYPRQDHAAVWTGTEMIVWGGRRLIEEKQSYGWRSPSLIRYYIYPAEVGRYNPTTDTWTRKYIETGPRGRASFAAVWTGQEMIIWGGSTDRSRMDNEKVVLNDGARFDPATGSWKPMASAGAPSGRERPIGLWTGNEMIILGGSGEGNKGARYYPAQDSWTPTRLEGAPLNSFANAAVWTGEGMLVFQDALSCYFEPGIYAGDQLPDGWQHRHFGANNPQGLLGSDFDHDGQDNLHEYLAGTDPTDANSRFDLRIEKVSGQPGSIQITFNPRLENRTYALEVRTNLHAGSFARLDRAKPENHGASGVFLDSNRADAVRFYRVRISLP